MKHITKGMLAVALTSTLWANPVAAMNCWFAPHYELSLRTPTAVLSTGGIDSIMPSRPFEVGGGVAHGFGAFSGQTFEVDGAVTLARRYRMGAGLGFCAMSDAPENPLVVGVGGAAELLRPDGERYALTAQLGVSRFSNSGTAVVTVPLIVGAGYDLRPNVTVYAGPMLNFTRSSSGGDSYSYSSSDTRFGGVAGMQALVQRQVALNASLAALREGGYRECYDGTCYGDGASFRTVASVRLVYALRGR
jgi:hypothetical protein